MNKISAMICGLAVSFAANTALANPSTGGTMHTAVQPGYKKDMMPSEEVTGDYKPAHDMYSDEQKNNKKKNMSWGEEEKKHKHKKKHKKHHKEFEEKKFDEKLMEKHK